LTEASRPVSGENPRGLDALRPGSMKENRPVPYATAADGVRLYYEESGSGFPILFVHEFAGDLRSWEAQIGRFSQQYRCLAYNARGYPPSDVPSDPSAYSQQHAVDDAVAVLEAGGVDHAHVVGLSMGGFAEHDAVGAANTMRGVQKERPSLYDLGGQLERVQVPVLVVTGDEDEACLEPDLMLKRSIPTAGLLVLPKTGHTLNLEEPEL